MQLHGKHFIGSQTSAEGGETFRGFDPSAGRDLDPVYHEASAGEVDRAMRLPGGGVGGGRREAAAGGGRGPRGGTGGRRRRSGRGSSSRLGRRSTRSVMRWSSGPRRRRDCPPTRGSRGSGR